MSDLMTASLPPIQWSSATSREGQQELAQHKSKKSKKAEAVTGKSKGELLADSEPDRPAAHELDSFA